MSEFNTIGFAGVGNMGRALLEGILEAGLYAPEKIYIFDTDADKIKRLGNKEVNAAGSTAELAEKTDILVLCVKPDKVKKVIEEAGSNISVISIAAGITLSALEKMLDSSSRVIRVMPNTPAQIGEGMSFLSPGEGVGEDFLEKSRAVFQSVGEAVVVDESKMDAATALSGSGPAYVFYFLEALEEAGVYLGLDSETAHQAAAQTLLGAAKLAAESKLSPATLRRQVSSPGGTTVEAIKYLDDAGVKGKIIEAIHCARDKSRRLSE